MVSITTAPGVALWERMSEISCWWSLMRSSDAPQSLNSGTFWSGFR